MRFPLLFGIFLSAAKRRKRWLQWWFTHSLDFLNLPLVLRQKHSPLIAGIWSFSQEIRDGVVEKRFTIWAPESPSAFRFLQSVPLSEEKALKSKIVSCSQLSYIWKTSIRFSFQFPLVHVFRGLSKKFWLCTQIFTSCYNGILHQFITFSSLFAYFYILSLLTCASQTNLSWGEVSLKLGKVIRALQIDSKWDTKIYLLSATLKGDMNANGLQVITLMVNETNDNPYMIKTWSRTASLCQVTLPTNTSFTYFFLVCL